MPRVPRASPPFWAATRSSSGMPAAVHIGAIWSAEPRPWSPGAEEPTRLRGPVPGAPAPRAAARGASGNGTHRSAVNGHGEAGQAGSR